MERMASFIVVDDSMGVSFCCTVFLLALAARVPAICCPLCCRCPRRAAPGVRAGNKACDPCDSAGEAKMVNQVKVYAP